MNCDVNKNSANFFFFCKVLPLDFLRRSKEPMFTAGKLRLLVFC